MKRSHLKRVLRRAVSAMSVARVDTRGAVGVEFVRAHEALSKALRELDREDAKARGRADATRGT